MKRFQQRKGCEQLWQFISPARTSAYPASHRCRPGVVAHSWLSLVVLWLSAGGSTDGRVGEVHVWRHGRRVCRATGLGIGEVVGRAWRRHAAMRRRSPAQTSHVRAATHTIWPVVVIGRRLKWLRRSIWMRSHGRPCVRSTAKA